MKNSKIEIIIDDVEISKIYYEFEINNNLEYLYSNKLYIQKVVNYLLKNDNEDYFLPLSMVLKLCIDFYTFDEDGRILIDDVDYDKLMEKYIKHGGKQITTSDYPSTMWPIEKHTAPFMVGSIKKTYDNEELEKYLSTFNSERTKFMVMPKYDGISACIELRDNKIIKALTRKDGVNGQNISPILKQSKFIFNENNSKLLNYCINKGGFIKCELCVSTENFEELINIKKYKNRRSATSGIINTPKNINLSKFISIIPLYWVSEDFLDFEFLCPITIDCDKYNVQKEKDKLLHNIRQPDFPFRVDGVVIFPYNKLNFKINTTDLLDDSIAFKINTKYGISKLEGIYPSIGRFGKVTPMAKIQPCEVNETTVTDVSLSNIDKMHTFSLHENEEVFIYSAGDVIPMMSLPNPRIYDKKSKIVKLQDFCPYCHKKFELVGKDLYCTNPNCKRIITGKIINFLDKLDVQDVSDRTIEILYENNILESITDIFKLKPDNQEIINKISDIEGFNKISAMNLCNAIDDLIKRPIEISVLLGSLGIPSISKKKCKLISNYFSIDKLLSYLKKYNYETIVKIMEENIKGIKEKTAIPYIIFIDNNKDLIKFLRNNMNIIDNKIYKGNIVFTGFRDKSYKSILEEKGYELSENINSDTKYLIVGDWNKKGKISKAEKKKIPMIDRSKLDELIFNL